ncbi:interferon-induced protein with tetratricopeptide repeats 5-like isoform X2 [Heteronotia binoei]|uniref:interferon-induced protein with tetratricopeptide repeats 5-like isoform X1 n=1 Tax=Heteronotia binoei TaxID=13085 RepID=UPI002931B5EF|nr:interferon-induced protein with tetratricopeptide repeats 5-like isoform X1 [Heteronotia binoei]XP_060097277.1 interferon-induced protein with tetratricopeptide repeats 5-like isoform X2 [Heteronotia binoei]
MSEVSKESLQKVLLQLECHFTWMLLKEDITPNELEERVEYLIEFVPSKSKIQNYNLLAYANHLNGKKEDALENLQKAEEAVQIEYPKEIEKASLVTWGNYAWLYYHMGQLGKAQEYIKKVECVCKQHGSDSLYKMNLPHIYCEKGWAVLRFGGSCYEKAKESFAKALEEEPQNPDINAGYAITLYRMEDYYGKKSSAEGSSLEPLRRAANLNPSDAFVVPIFALKLQEVGQAEEGEKYIKEALQKNPDAPYALRYAAKFYRKKGDVIKSLELLEKALELTPNSSFLHHQIGLCYRTQFREKKRSRCQDREKMELIGHCIFHFQKAVEHKPKFVYAYLDLATMYGEAKQLQEAEETFQKVFTMTKLSWEDKQELHFSYGHYQQFHNNSESEAVKHYLEGLKIEKESISREQCKDYLKKLIERKIYKSPGDAKSFGILGYIHQLSGESRQAIECYERALEMDPDNEEYLSALWVLRLYLQS